MKKIGCFLFIFLLFGQCGFAQKAKKNKKTDNSIGQFANYEDYRNQSNILLDAVVCRNSGNYVEAENKLKELLIKNPSYDLAHFEYAKLLLIKNNVKQAIEELNTALTLCDTNRWIKSLLAEAYDRNQQYDKSEKLWKNLGEKYIENPEYIYKYAISLIYQNKLKEAIDAYNIIETQMGVSEDIIIAKRNIWLQLKKVENAVKEMNKLHVANPTDIRYPLDIADIYINNKMEEKAIPYLQKAGEIDPTNPQINIGLYNYYAESKQYDNALKYLKRAFAASELDIDEKVRILMSFYGQKLQKQAAYDLLDSLVKAHPEEPKAWAIYGDFLFQDRQFLPAKDAFEHVLSLDKSKYPIWEHYLTILLGLSEWNKAVEQAQEAQSLFPMQALPYLVQGISYFYLEKQNEAIGVLKEGLNYATNNEMVTEFHFFLAKSYMENKQIDETISHFEKALEKSPKNDMLLNEYGYFLAEQNMNLEYAQQLSKKSLEISENEAYLDTYAWILFKQGKYAEAKTWIEKALTKDGENDVDILEHYSQILEKLGKSELFDKYKTKLLQLKNKTNS